LFVDEGTKTMFGVREGPVSVFVVGSLYPDLITSCLLSRIVILESLQDLILEVEETPHLVVVP
jgi:hypothetical protein